jgi:GxxExxY protein
MGLPTIGRCHCRWNTAGTDLVVERQLIIELKTVEQILPIHAAQVLTYLRLTRLPLALLINFNVVLLKQGLRRFALTDLAFSASSAPLR